MDGERHPGTSILSVLPRVNSIFSNRVREEQLRYVASHCGPAESCIVHLRKGLRPESIAYYDNKERAVGGEAAPQTPLLEQKTTPEVQWTLSRIRTDLDAFNDAEAFALMCNAYRITGAELKKATRIWERRGRVTPSAWRFLEVAPLLERPTERFLKVLRAGGSNVFKVLILYRSLAALTVAASVSAVTAVAWVYWDALRLPVIPPEAVPSRIEVAGTLLALATAAYVSRWKLARWLHRFGRLVSWCRRPTLWVYRLAVRGLVPVLASLPLALYLKFFNPLYLRAGRIDRLIDKGLRRSIRIPVEDPVPPVGR